MTEMSFAFRSSSRVSSKQMGREILSQVTNGNLVLLFFTTSKFKLSSNTLTDAAPQFL